MHVEDFYKPVNIENLIEIQQEVLKFISPNLLNQSSLTYIENSKEIFLSIPVLYNFLKSKNMHQSVMNIAINITLGNNQGNIHVDSGPYNHSLNIPIVGSDNTWINFFKANSDYKVITIENKGKTHHFFKYTDDQCELIHKAETNQPYLLGTKTPHKVINKSDQTRIMLLIRMFPGPWANNI